MVVRGGRRQWFWGISVIPVVSSIALPKQITWQTKGPSGKLEGLVEFVWFRKVRCQLESESAFDSQASRGHASEIFSLALLRCFMSSN